MDKLDKSLDDIVKERRKNKQQKPKPKPGAKAQKPKAGDVVKKQPGGKITKPALKKKPGIAARLGPKVNVDVKRASQAVASAVKSNNGPKKAGGKAPVVKKGKAARAAPYSVATSKGTLAGTGKKAPISARLGPSKNGAKKPPAPAPAKSAAPKTDLRVTITNDNARPSFSPPVAEPAVTRGRGILSNVRGMIADQIQAAARPTAPPAPAPPRQGPGLSIAGAASGAVGPRTGAATVKVSNLHAEATEQDLKAALSEFGKVIRVSILYNSTGVSTGEAHVVFADRADALKCIRSLDGQMADGRTLKCEEIKTLTIAGAARFEGGKGAAPSRAMASAPGAKPPISQRITKPQGRQSGFRG